MTQNTVVPYTATGISIAGRFIFMYLLYTKRSVNNLSLLFCIMNMVSSSLWLHYGNDIGDEPILVRSLADITLFALSAGYIIRNKYARDATVQVFLERSKNEIVQGIAVMVLPERSPTSIV